jgi:hypothetical protein
MSKHRRCKEFGINFPGAGVVRVVGTAVAGDIIGAQGNDLFKSGIRRCHKVKSI